MRTLTSDYGSLASSRERRRCVVRFVEQVVPQNPDQPHTGLQLLGRRPQRSDVSFSGRNVETTGIDVDHPAALGHLDTQLKRIGHRCINVAL